MWYQVHAFSANNDPTRGFVFFPSFVQAAADAGVKQFVFISVHDYKAPSAVKKVGYFDGKRRTEKVIGELFGEKVRDSLGERERAYCARRQPDLHVNERRFYSSL